MINLSNIGLLKEGISALETIMKAGGMPKGAKLKHVRVQPDGLLFIMQDDTEWKATVTLAKVK